MSKKTKTKQEVSELNIVEFLLRSKHLAKKISKELIEDLMKEFKIREVTVKFILYRLEKKGYIEREPTILVVNF